MRTFSITLALLLLLNARCCNTMPEALKFSTSHGSCCFKVCPSILPVKHVATVTKTHSSCLIKAFIIKTIKGRQICYSQTLKWAQSVYKKLHNRGSTGQLH